MTMRGRERGERGSREKKAFLHSLKKKKKGEKSWKRRPVDVQDRRHERTRYPLNESLIFFLRRPLVVHYKTVERYLPTHFHKTFQWTCIISLLSRSILPFFFDFFSSFFRVLYGVELAFLYHFKFKVQSVSCFCFLFWWMAMGTVGDLRTCTE